MIIMHSVAICMATYNGNKYIAQQIDSILKQDYQEFTLYIHDDGSTDGTISTIKKYVANNPNKIIFFDDDISYKNAGANFIETLKQVPTHDFYMFCDQDDYWLETKISKTLEKILNEGNDLTLYPIIGYTNMSVTDEHLNIVKEKIYSAEFILSVSKYSYEDSVAIGCFLAGCTTMFNHAAKQITLSLKYPNQDRKMFHDYWLQLCVLSNKNGQIIYLDDPTILYRQHESNTIGYKVKIHTIIKYPLLKIIISMLDVISIIKLYLKVKKINKCIPKKVYFIKIFYAKYNIKYKKNKSNLDF